jgi:TetR/AcrR family transcriptional repressor of bet genes
VTGASRVRRARGIATVERLLEATVAVLGNDGVAAVSVQRIADEAGTSKGLVHYHFADKDALLSACARRLTSAVIEGEADALRGASARTALDRLWSAFSGTTRDGTRRALLALCADAAPAARPALAELAAHRQRAAEESVALLEALLEFSPMVPRATLATAYLALTDGLALRLTVRPSEDCRPAFDAFWLAVLTLGAE